MGILRTNKVSGLETPTPVTGSVSFDGDGDYLSIPSSGDFAYGTGDFTWEVWVYVNSFSGNRYVLDHDSNGGTIGNGGGGNTKLHYYNATIGTGSVLYTTGFGTNLSTNTWYHLAAVRKNGTTSLYTNGVLTASASDSHNYGAQVLNIGRYGAASSGYEFNGFISNLRILKGTALYTSNFTPPTRELQPIGDTVLLCCNNPDSAGAEATGKAITVNGNAAASTFSPGLVRDFTYGTQFDGVSKFDTQGYFVPPSGTTENRFPNFGSIEGARGVFCGGYNPGAPVSVANLLEYLTISTTGNTLDFGDLSIAPIFGNSAACSSSSRGLFMGGENNTTQINYITISTMGNSSTFGQLTLARRALGGCSNATRGLAVNGFAAARSNVIDYVTIATEGNALDFGDTVEASYSTSCCGSPTRGVFTGGNTPTPANLNTIQYVTFASLGNTSDFGDLTSIRFNHGCSSNITRGVMGGGQTPTTTNTIDYITIATLGNAVSFGNLTVSRTSSPSVASSVRGVFAGGTGTPSYTNTIDYVTISTVGNATDFGDLIAGRSNFAGCSNGHGGLG
jgi:hypothetical protein